VLKKETWKEKVWEFEQQKLVPKKVLRMEQLLENSSVEVLIFQANKLVQV